MTRVLIDTTFLIDAERGEMSLDDAIGDEDDLAIAAITLAELWVGALLANEPRRARRARFVQAVADTIPLLSYDFDVATAHAALLAHTRRSGTPRGAHDLIIASTAVASDRVLVTADRTGFVGLPGVDVRQYG